MWKIFATLFFFALLGCEDGGVSPIILNSDIDGTTSYLTFLESNYGFDHVFTMGDTLNVNIHYNIANREYCNTCTYGMYLYLRTSTISVNRDIVIDTLLGASGDATVSLPINESTDQYLKPHLISISLFQRVGTSRHEIANLGLVYGN
ncbi:MAG: hypothetical protein GX556_11065 [Fibrobacter sp.]|nr:hypothetical protein [Fibrobacter sp.]